MEDELLTFIAKNWTIIFFVGSLIWSYANLKGHVGQLHSRLKTVEEEVGKMNPIWQEIRERLARIETSLSIHFKEK